MKSTAVILWCVILAISESHDINTFRTFFANYMRQNGQSQQMFRNYFQHPRQTQLERNQNNRNGLEQWTKEERKKFLDAVEKEYGRNQRKGKNHRPDIDARIGGADEADNKDSIEQMIKKIFVSDLSTVKEDQSIKENKDIPLEEMIKEIFDPESLKVKEDQSNKHNNKDTALPAEECLPSPTHVKGRRKCKNQLIFNDNFQKVNNRYWTIEQKIAGAPDYEFVAYINQPETCEVIQESSLNIEPVITEKVFGPQVFEDGIDFGSNCTDKKTKNNCMMKPDAGFMVPPVASALLTTANKFSFRFGKIEIRAKLPFGDWIYPIMYLNPERELYGKYYQSGQIRIAYTEGNAEANKILKGGIVLGENDRARNYGIRNITSSDNWSDTFHKFELTWNPESISVSVDGTRYGLIEPPKSGFASLANDLKISNSEHWKNGSLFAPFDKEMHLVIGVGVGGLNFQDTIDGKPWKNKERLQDKKFYMAKENWLPTWNENKTSLKIDYIKIWAL